MTTLTLKSARIPKSKQRMAKEPKHGGLLSSITINDVVVDTPIPIETLDPPILDPAVLDKPKPVAAPKRKKPMANLSIMGPVFWDYIHPLAIGIHKQIFLAYPDISRVLIRRALQSHVNHHWYRLVPGMDRYNLDGTVSGRVTEL